MGDVKTISTLEDWLEYIPQRMSGNTTRIVDRAIQILFNGDTCLVRDHYEGGENRNANEMLLDKIVRRLEIEHYCGKRGLYVVDRNNLSIALVPSSLNHIK
jgi:hypothetical protein